MNKLMEIVHPGEDHLLNFFEGSESVSLSDEEDHVLEFDEEDHYLGLALSQTCHKCMQPVSRRDYYKCTEWTCGYYLHKECFELKDLPQKHHPLHPQHPLAEHLNYPCEKSFVCSFCGETKQSRRFYQCSDDQCDFYLDTTCEREFEERPELLDKYEIQHVLHHHGNHRLSPCILNYTFGTLNRCAGCAYKIINGSRGYKCIACPFRIHTECAQVPKEVMQHPSHPHHPLVLIQNPPPPAAHHDHSDDEVRCAACLKPIENEFYLHCNHCPTFNLDLHCYLRFFKLTFKHEAHHEHSLAFFFEIYDNVVRRCYACNTPCNYQLFRCFTCNFNIHHDCLDLPNTVNYYDHVHPLTLTTSFKQDGDPTTYYCDICEKRRDTDRGLYLCKESGCSFMAHFECALSLSNTEKEKRAHAPWRQEIEEDNHTSDEEEDMTLTNEKVSLEIFDQLNVEIEKLGEVIQQLIIKKREGQQLTGKIQEFDERRTNAEDMLRQLNQSVRGTKYN